MDFLLELILEIILDGVIDTVMETRVPLPIRILLAAVLLLLYLGFAGVLIYWGINGRNSLVVIIGIFVLLLAAGAFWWNYKKFRNNKRNE